MLQFCMLTTRGGAVAARVAHNHEVEGSSPSPATKMISLLIIYTADVAV